MTTIRIWNFIQNNVFPLHPEPTKYPLYNPYSGAPYPSLQVANAGRIRQDNLRQYIKSFSTLPDYLVIGEAYGWRGGRYSGVPFTSEAMLKDQTLPFCGAPTSLRQPPYREASATIFWRVMLPYYPKFIAWNCLPLHPHHPGKPLSNRTPTKVEIQRYEPLLMEMHRLLDPQVVIAVGRSAQAALENLGIAAIAVRHPSHGGTKEFEAGIRQIFKQH